MIKLFCKNKKYISIILAVALIFQMKFLFVSQKSQATTKSWDFLSASDYVFDDTKIELSSGYAQLKASSNWYNTSWTRRKEITITGSTAGAQTNYQLKIPVSYDSDMQVDFDDVRFTSSDGVTLIDHWLESKTDSSTADFWVEVPSIPASPSTTTIYLYYGNTRASSVSNGSNTFVSGTDFSQDDSFVFRESGVNESLGNKTGAMRSGSFTNGIGEDWVPYLLLTDGRLDSIDYLGNGVILVGSRSPSAGHIYKSTDYGKTWTDKGAVMGTDDLTAIKSVGSGVAYLLTGDSYLYKTTDYGENFVNLGKVSANTACASASCGELSYGLLITNTGTILVADTAPTGGHIFRSTNGGTSFSDLGAISTKSLYRFDKIGDGVIVNGWDGRVFKSTDDGATWVDKGQLANSGLYATEYLGNGVVLQGNEAGNVFRSTDNAETWTNLGDLGDSMDDFAYLGNGVVVASTYNGSMYMHRSTDNGLTWSNIGTVTTGVAGDSLEHVTYINDGANQFGIGVTNKGYFLRSPAGVPQSLLKKINLDRTSDSYVRKQLSSSVNNNFAVRIKVNPTFVSDKIAWLPVAAISTTGERACSTNNNYALAIIQRASLGLGLVEFKGANQSPCYSTLTELTTSLNTSYIIEIRKVSSTSASIYIYNEDGTLFGTNSLTISNQNYNYLMAHIPAPSGWISATSQQNINYIFLRNYVSSEPTFSIGSESFLYDINNPTISLNATTTQTFSSISGFSEVAVKNGGQIKYQISKDGGTTWYWYNSGWATTTAGYIEANTASDINSNIKTFPINGGQFSFKAYLNSNGNQLVQLDSISLTADTHTLTYTAGTHGTISGTASQTVDYGSNGTAVTAVPDSGYHFVSWSDSSTTNPRTDTNVTSDISVTASFATNTHTLTYTAGSHGTISGTASQTVDYGSNGTAVTAVPDSGYHFKSWDDGVLTAERTDTNITANHTYVASFEATGTTTYNISSSSGSHGSISPLGTVNVNSGDNQSFNIVADSGYSIADVVVDGSSVGSVSSYQFNNVSADHTISVSFTKNPTVSGGGSGSMTAGWSSQLVIPIGGFKVEINEGKSITSNRFVTLKFNANNANADKMAISLTGDFSNAILEDYSASKQIDLCQNSAQTLICPDGQYTIYVKFYNKQGTSSDVVVQKITLLTGKQPLNNDETKNNNGTFVKDLKLGIKDDQVKTLQQFLNQNGFNIAKSGVGSTGKETNFFGSLTSKALIKFQEANKNKVVGLIGERGYLGPLTRELINSIMINKVPLNSTQPTTNSSSIGINTPLYKGMQSEYVYKLQKLLAAKKDIYPEGLITGYFGLLTEKAVQNFQLKYGVVGSKNNSGFGVVGPKTIDKLQEVFKD